MNAPDLDNGIPKKIIWMFDPQSTTLEKLISHVPKEYPWDIEWLPIGQSICLEGYVGLLIDEDILFSSSKSSFLTECINSQECISPVLAVRSHLQNRKSSRQDVELYMDAFNRGKLNHSIDFTLSEAEIIERSKIVFSDLWRRIELAPLSYADSIQREKMMALGELANGLVSELEPLFHKMILLSTSLSEQVEESSVQKDDLSEIKNASERCIQILKNLSDFANGSLEQSYEVVSLNQLIEKTLPLLKRDTGPFLFDLDLTSDDTWIWGVPQLLQQVIFNLVQNACDSMDAKQEPRGKLTLRSFIESSSGEKLVHMEIEDSGIGIPQSAYNTIFDAFYTTKKESFGTGLGLYLCKKIIEISEGSMSVKSREGEGSLFSISLPLKPMISSK